MPFLMVLAAGFEPATSSFGGKHSIHLSYASVNSDQIISFNLITRDDRNMLDADRFERAFTLFLLHG